MEDWKKCDKAIAEHEKQETKNSEFKNLLIANGITNVDYVDEYGCQIGGIDGFWFEAQIYLGDLTGMTDREIAQGLAENIKATFDEINC